MTIGIRSVLAASVLALAAMAGAAEQDGKKTEKPVVTCDQIVEVYKSSQSIDQTSSQLLVDQSRVSECLKAAGIVMPEEKNN